MNRCLIALFLGQLTCQLAAQPVDYSRLKLAHTLPGHDTAVTAMAFSPDSEILAAASYDDAIRLWDLSTGKTVAVLRGPGDTIRAVTFSPDGKVLAAASRDKTIRIWDVAARKQTTAHSGTSEARTLTFSPNGKILASASHDKTIGLWNLETGEKKTIATGHRTWVREIIFSPDGKLLASNGYYGVKVWDTAGNAVGQLEGRVSAMSFDDGQTLTSAIGHKIRRWQISKDNEPTVFKGKESVLADRFVGILSPNGNALASVDQDVVGVDLGRGVAPFGKKRCRLIVLDATSGRESVIYERRGTENWFHPISFSPSGEVIALWNWERETATLIDATDGKLLAKFSPPDGRKFRPGRMPPLMFAPNGKSFAICHGPRIVIWGAP